MKPRTASRFVAFGLLSAVVSAWMPAALADDDKIRKALKEGEVDFDLRYRYEAVDQASTGPLDPVVNNAKASTLRLRLGYETGGYRGLFGYAGFEALRVVGAERYNSTANGLGSYPVVADPEDEEINQAYLGYRGLENTVFKLGRQRIALENRRFIGNVGWRQNEQTFDAFSAQSTAVAGLDIYYAHLNNANRIFGEHNPVQARANTNLFGDVLQVSHKTSAGKVTGYAHFLEFEDSPAASHRNIGVRFAGSHSFSDDLDLLYAAELADQSDYKDAPAAVDAGYRLVEVGVKTRRITARVGYEVLEGDGTYAFQTPLATLHAFNGWTDKFLTTPAAGLEDTYIKFSTALRDYRIAVVYHDFDSDSGSAAFGTETGLAVGKTFRKMYTVHFKYASFDADASLTDVDKLWVTLQFKP